MINGSNVCVIRAAQPLLNKTLAPLDRHSPNRLHAAHQSFSTSDLSYHSSRQKGSSRGRAELVVLFPPRGARPPPPPAVLHEPACPSSVVIVGDHCLLPSQAIIRLPQRRLLKCYWCSNHPRYHHVWAERRSRPNVFSKVARISS